MSTPIGARAQLLGTMPTLRWPAHMPPNGANPRDAAVLVLFGVLDAISAATPDAAVARDLDVLLQRRAPTLSSHPGQVSFPGGRAEPQDADLTATALREAAEEVGLDPSGVDVLGSLPAAPLPVSNNRVTPVLGWWTTPARVAAVDHAETVEVFRVPVAELLDPANRYMGVREMSGTRFRAPAFAVDGVVVWGFTAIVLHTLFDYAGWSAPWDTARELDV